jgi:hypothetical protein
MKSWLHSLYRRLPIIREINQSLRPLNAALITQALEAVKASDIRYRDKQRLMAHGAQYWSQNYEDGMIAEIFQRIGATSKTFVEIGVGDGSENNTTALLSQGWQGWWIEGDPNSCESIRNRLKTMPSLSRRLTLRESFVSPGKIAEIFQEVGIPVEVDLFSLDIDQDTYHIWAALSNFKPRVVVVEYNGGIPSNQSWIQPYEPGKFWNGTQAFGASLKAYELLGRKFGYSLVGCDLIGMNAFFVRNDLVADHFNAPFTAENHYEPPRYHLSFRWGHAPSFFGESHTQ